jgi:hypothetical protein
MSPHFVTTAQISSLLLKTGFLPAEAPTVFGVLSSRAKVPEIKKPPKLGGLASDTRNSRLAGIVQQVLCEAEEKHHQHQPPPDNAHCGSPPFGGKSLYIQPNLEPCKRND